LALPSQLQERAFRGPLRPLVGRLESSARLAGIDWSATRAFSEEVNTFPAIWLNVRGREPAGTVSAGAEYEELRDEILARIACWRNPATGEAVVEHAWRREEIYDGAAVDQAPDIILAPALDSGYTYTLLSSGGQPGDAIRDLTPAERLGAKGGSMNGSHRPDGLLLLAGKGVQPGVHLDRAHITDVTPTLLALLDAPLPANLDGRVLWEALARRDPVCSGPPLEEGDQPTEPYSANQAAIVGARLRGLGYQE
jgi:predicted AlkP superfamily phosphohydrolase/phosphomutase